MLIDEDMTSQSLLLRGIALGRSSSTANVADPATRLEQIAQRQIDHRFWDQFFILVVVAVTLLTVVGIVA